MRAGETRTRTSPSRRRSRRRGATRCPRTTSSGRSTAGPAAGGGDEQIERVVYEGYGPGGAAVLVDALTDNRNRTGAEVRHAFDKAGGSLGEPGSVAWQFEKKGVILVDGERYSEDDLIAAIDAGAEDVALDGDVLKVTAEPAGLGAVRAALEGTGSRSSRPSWRWSRTLSSRSRRRREARALVRLMESLDDHDDVEAVHANFDIPESLLEQVAA